MPSSSVTPSGGEAPQDPSPLYVDEAAAPVFTSMEGGEGDFMQDATDVTTDPVALEERKKRQRLLITLLLTALVLGVGGFFGYQYLTREAKTPPPTPTASPEDPRKKEVTYNPVKEAAGAKAPKVLTGATKVGMQRGGLVVAKPGKTLRLQGHKLASAVEVCTVKDPTDFCLVGTGSGNGATYEVYYLKDAAHSRLFEGIQTFKATPVAGALTAGTLSLKVSGDERPAAVVVAPTSEGWLLLGKGDKNEVGKVLPSASVK